MNFKALKRAGLNVLATIPLLTSCRTADNKAQVIKELEEGIQKLEVELRRSLEERKEEGSKKIEEEPRKREEIYYSGPAVVAMPFDNTHRSYGDYTNTRPTRTYAPRYERTESTRLESTTIPSVPKNDTKSTNLPSEELVFRLEDLRLDGSHKYESQEDREVRKAEATNLIMTRKMTRLSNNLEDEFSGNTNRYRRMFLGEVRDAIVDYFRDEAERRDLDDFVETEMFFYIIPKPLQRGLDYAEDSMKGGMNWVLGNLNFPEVNNVGLRVNRHLEVRLRPSLNIDKNISLVFPGEYDLDNREWRIGSSLRFRF